MKTFVKQFSVLILFFFPSIGFGQDEDFNSSKNWDIELQSYGVSSLAAFNVNLHYRNKKNSFFAGGGFAKYYSYTALEPVLIMGYRKYPGRNLRPLKFYYQTFLYYSSNHHTFIDELYSNKYLTANFGVGLDYSISQKFSAGLNSNLGWGHDFIEKSGVFTIFPLQLSLRYKFGYR